MVVIDTDVIIWILRGNREVIDRFKAVVEETDAAVFVTPIQIAEIFAGVHPKEKVKVENFMESIGIINIDEKIGRLAGEYMNKYRKSHNVTLADAMIGAAAMLNGCKLWTGNKRHFPMCDNTEYISILDDSQ